MPRSLAAILASSLSSTLLATTAQAAPLPDLKGQTIVAVTENAYLPLNFIHPKTGQAVGWEYDALTEIARRHGASAVGR